MVTSEAQCLSHVCDLQAASGFDRRAGANGSKHEKDRAAGRPPVTYLAPTHSRTQHPGPCVLLTSPGHAATIRPQSKCLNELFWSWSACSDPSGSMVSASMFPITGLLLFGTITSLFAKIGAHSSLLGWRVLF